MKPLAIMQYATFFGAGMPVFRKLHGNACRGAIGITQHRRETCDRHVAMLGEHQSRYRGRIGIIAQGHTPAIDAIQVFFRIIGSLRIAPGFFW